MTRFRPRVVLLALVATLCGGLGPVGAQSVDPVSGVQTADEAESTRSAPLGYGTASLSILNLTGPEFQPSYADTVYVRDSMLHWYVASGTANVLAPVQLPSGARVEFVELAGCDESVGSNINVVLADNVDPGSGATFRANFQSSGSGGCNFWSEAITPFTVDNLNRQLSMIVSLTPGTSLRIRGVRVYWRRQVSPAPGVATFGDVPTGHPFFPFVEALAASGITSGCGGGNFCPDAPLTRGQMAVFLADALGLHWAN